MNKRLLKLSREYVLVNAKWYAPEKLYRKLKLFYYSFHRPLVSFFLSRKKIFEVIRNKYHVDLILKGSGGTSKEYNYRQCEKLNGIEGKNILVPGCGPGEHLLTLMSFKPARITAFDLFEYTEEWEFVKQKGKEKGVEIVLLKADVDSAQIKERGYFDWIISDAVLEHIKELENFMNSCGALLKEDGYFYATFGPLWYGPGGDHMAGEKALFNHLLFSAEAYREYIGLLKQTNDRDSNDGIFLYEQGLFSYLYAEDYLKIIEKTGFNINLMHLQYSNAAFRFLSGHPGEKVKIIEKYGVVFDLYCGGINIWARKIGARETL